ncbi:hypothetical protein GGG16DRAFT_109157 [Schizophyllum commune]
MRHDGKFDGNFDDGTQTLHIVDIGYCGSRFDQAMVDSARETHTFTDFNPPPETPREEYTIHYKDGGYSIKSVQHGTYLGFHGPSFIGSKEPFKWTVEPMKKDDGKIRFTIPNTEMYLDFAKAPESKPKADETQDRSGPSLGGYGYMHSPPHWRSK